MMAMHQFFFYVQKSLNVCLMKPSVSNEHTYAFIYFVIIVLVRFFHHHQIVVEKKNEILGKFLKWNRYKFRFSMVVFPLSFIFCCVCVCFACCFCFLFCLYSDLNFIALIFIHSVFRFFLSVWLMYAFTEYDVGIVQINNHYGMVAKNNPIYTEHKFTIHYDYVCILYK